MAENIPLPILPPRVLDVMKFTTNNNGGKPPLIIQHGQRMVHQSAKPFQGEENVFRENPHVKSEYEALCQDYTRDSLKWDDRTLHSTPKGYKYIYCCEISDGRSIISLTTKPAETIRDAEFETRKIKSFKSLF